MDESTKLHIKRVREWLQENVQVFPAPQSITLSDFDVDWDEFGGSFRVTLDDTAISDKFYFFLEGSGTTTFYPPMFHSPLGAPASYAAVVITPKTEKAIAQALHKTIPKIIGSGGTNKETGLKISIGTSPEFRITAEALRDAEERVTEDYSVTVSLESV